MRPRSTAVPGWHRSQAAHSCCCGHCSNGRRRRPSTRPSSREAVPPLCSVMVTSTFTFRVGSGRRSLGGGGAAGGGGGSVRSRSSAGWRSRWAPAAPARAAGLWRAGLRRPAGRRPTAGRPGEDGRAEDGAAKQGGNDGLQGLSSSASAGRSRWAPSRSPLARCLRAARAARVPGAPPRWTRVRWAASRSGTGRPIRGPP